jgi:hypothetical protein
VLLLNDTDTKQMLHRTATILFGRHRARIDRTAPNLLVHTCAFFVPGLSKDQPSEVTGDTFSVAPVKRLQRVVVSIYLNYS